MRVAMGYALPNTPEATFHCNPIPAGYARVGVDEIEPGYDGLELDIPGGEGEVHTCRSRPCSHSMEKGLHRLSTLGAKATGSSEYRCPARGILARGITAPVLPTSRGIPLR